MWLIVSQAHLANKEDKKGKKGRKFSPHPILEIWYESSLYLRCSEPILSDWLSQFK